MVLHRGIGIEGMVFFYSCLFWQTHSLWLICYAFSVYIKFSTGHTQIQSVPVTDSLQNFRCPRLATGKIPIITGYR